METYRTLLLSWHPETAMDHESVKRVIVMN